MILFALLFITGLPSHAGCRQWLHQLLQTRSQYRTYPEGLIIDLQPIARLNSSRLDVATSWLLRENRIKGQGKIEPQIFARQLAFLVSIVGLYKLEDEQIHALLDLNEKLLHIGSYGPVIENFFLYTGDLQNAIDLWEKEISDRPLPRFISQRKPQREW